MAITHFSIHSKFDQLEIAIIYHIRENLSTGVVNVLKQKEVLEMYEITKSLKASARALKLSEQTIKKILISNGIYPSERSREVTRLRLAGLTIPEIAQYLGISEKAVRMNMPYTKCSYAVGQKSQNAKCIAKCRAAKKKVGAEDS